MTARRIAIVSGAARGLTLIALPLRTENLLNARMHWSARARKTKHLRGVVGVVVRGGYWWDGRPVVVEVTRVAPSDGLDPHDGLPASMKPVVDGIADALGLASDRDPRVAWRYAQRRGPWGIEIRIRDAEQKGAAG